MKIDGINCVPAEWFLRLLRPGLRLPVEVSDRDE
jgi:hypothetical protein